MLKCTWIREIERHFDGQSPCADAARAADVARHMAACAECRAHQARLTAMRDALRSTAPSHAPELSDAQFPAFMRGIQERLDAPAPQRARWWTWASLTAAALLVATATFVLVNNGPAPAEATVIESCSTDIEGGSVTSYKPETGVTTVWVTVAKDDVW